MERVSTGVAGLDLILKGGFFRGSSYLIVGDVGTGKTILALQWLLDGIKKDEKGLYITLAESAAQLRKNVSGFGWDLSSLKIRDFSPQPSELNHVGDYEVFYPAEVEEESFWQKLYQAVEEERPDRLVLDSVTVFHDLSANEYAFRRRLIAFIKFLLANNCTTLFLADAQEIKSLVSISMAVDGIVRLRLRPSKAHFTSSRNLEILKFRGSDVLLGEHSFRITSSGIKVFPHLIEKPVHTLKDRRVFSSGIKELDEMLGGGIEAGTVTLITGPSGLGKSTIAAQLITQLVKEGIPSVYYAFEEYLEMMLARCEKLNIPLAEALENGLLFERINPLELYPDEFLEMVRHHVEKGVRAVVIDSMRGYMLAMEEFSNLRSHFYNLVAYLTSKGVTTFIVNEIENLIGSLKISEIGISNLADNVILLRYAESRGKIIKVINCLKKRFGFCQPELRELEISSLGLRVGAPLTHLKGVLSGIPQVE